MNKLQICFLIKAKNYPQGLSDGKGHPVDTRAIIPGNQVFQFFIVAGIGHKIKGVQIEYQDWERNNIPEIFEIGILYLQ